MSNSYTFFIVIALEYFWNFADIPKYVQAIKINNNIFTGYVSMWVVIFIILTMSWLDCLFWCLKVRLDGTEFNKTISYIIPSFIPTHQQPKATEMCSIIRPYGGTATNNYSVVYSHLQPPPATSSHLQPPSVTASQAHEINICCPALIFTRIICYCKSAKFNLETFCLFDSWELQMIFSRVEMFCNKALNYGPLCNQLIIELNL